MASVASFNPDVTIGAFQIGVLVSYVLFGVMTTQMYIYYTRFPDDSLKLKVLVAFVWQEISDLTTSAHLSASVNRVCELVHALCIGHTLYVWTISDYGHPERLITVTPKSFDMSLLSAGSMVACVQGFFAFRIYRFSRKIIIPIIILIMTFLRLVGTIVLFATAWKMRSMDGYIAQWRWLATCIWSVTAAIDLTITTTLVFLLHRERDNVHRRTAATVDKLILWTLETGFLTSMGEIIELACFIAMNNNFIWLALYAVAPRLFSNSLLASLNSRATLRSMNEGNQMISLPNLAPANALLTGNADMTKSTPIVHDTGLRDKVVSDM
ncbi:hypothetical protein MVEN_01381300 [Mycena venus]|uniref:DUF6534 domain-containing protein n=1 Tax=Mycena venus TaxID=2733690 RepID=A0A8H6XUY8_9AGAR|nr:hypothetical protein MVEN_01381300 [Mycena venus]